MRLQNKIAIVVGAGQGPGTGMGNGRATVIRFAQEGAKVLCVDRDLKSAEETCAIAAKETNAGECAAFEADVTREASMKAMIDACKAKWGRIDVLHYNVGLSIAGGDPEAFVTQQVRANNFEILPIHLSHALKTYSLPEHHWDPFDRLLVAQSAVETLPLLSADRRLAEYRVRVIW